MHWVKESTLGQQRPEKESTHWQLSELGQREQVHCSKWESTGSERESTLWRWVSWVRESEKVLCSQLSALGQRVKESALFTAEWIGSKRKYSVHSQINWVRKRKYSVHRWVNWVRKRKCSVHSWMNWVRKIKCSVYSWMNWVSGGQREYPLTDSQRACCVLSMIK